MSELITTGAGERRLSAAEFQQLAAVPAAAEWCANIDNPRTGRAYQHDLEDFCGVVGLTGADEFRSHPRARAGLARPTGNLRPGRGHDPAQTGGVGQPVDHQRPPGASASLEAAIPRRR